jgi:hypothetical protein
MKQIKKIKNTNFKFDLGDDVEDIITGFTGIIVVRSQWIHNCNTYGLRSKVLKDDKPMDAQYFDEPQLKVVTKKVIKERRDTGGPCESIPATNR